MTDVNDENISTTIVALQSLIQDAKRLGLTWALRPATVSANSAVNSGGIVQIIQDGDTVPMLATNIVSRNRMLIGDRVMSVMVPPGGLYVIGVLGGGTGGYIQGEQILVTGSGTFTKGNYPGIRAVDVQVVGSGGGSGGVEATVAAQVAASAGGGGGGFSRRFILASNLSSSETLTVGAAGTAGAAGNNSGGTGGTVSFGGWLQATGGAGGQGGAAQANTVTAITSLGGVGGVGSGGDINLEGSNGGNGAVAVGERRFYSAGGSSGFAWGGTQMSPTTGAGSVGIAGKLFGGGASGAHSNVSQSARAGGAGAIGVIYIVVFY